MNRSELAFERRCAAKERAAETPATKRQLWALYCITKEDYRNRNLTKLQASNLLTELNCKSKRTKTSKSKNLLIADFEEQYKNIVDRVYKEFIVNVLNVQSDIIDKKENKTYAFFGFGCGFVWFTYNKNSKVLKEFDEYVQKAYRNRIIEDVKIKLGDICKSLEKLGSPAEALLYQDMNIKQFYYGLCADIATNHGKKIDVDYRLD